MSAERKPEWLRVRLRHGPGFARVRQLVEELRLHTVCQEARCPNVFECWEHGTATFMILGSVCTRACGFCAVKTGLPTELDLAEPQRVAEAVAALGLRHAVITSVARDDLRDGGASVFAATIAAVRQRCPDTTVEVLIPDFQGDEKALATVVQAGPDVLSHNLETVRRLTPRVRARARYDRSLEVLKNAKVLAARYGVPLLTKSGLMLGLGETREEVLEALRDLRSVDCDIVTLGQYLRPTPHHLPVARYVPPEEFQEYREAGLAMGFRHVEAGPLVRSSYRADRHVLGTAAPLPAREGDPNDAREVAPRSMAW